MVTEKKYDNSYESEFGIDQNVKNRILNSLENDLNSQVKKLFLELHPADQADLFSSLASEQREKLIIVVAADIDPEILAYLDDDLKSETIELLGSKNSAKAIDQLEIDDAVQVIESLESEGISKILYHISKDKRDKIEEALSYPENSVGRLMQKSFIAVKKDWSVAQATYYLQNSSDLPDDFNNIVIVDDEFHPTSEVRVSDILKNKKHIIMSEIMVQEEIKSLSVNMDKEEAAHIFSKYYLSYAPVVDEKGILVGVIYANDVIDILQEEAEEDILLLGGVNDGNLYSSSFSTARSRSPWLLASLFTTSLAVSIIAIFSDQIQKIVALAVLLPVVASLAGNSGTQALTVLVRAIATNEISNIGAIRIIIKEVIVGSFNGLMLALIAALVCYFWQHNLYLSVVFAVAILGTQIVSGFFGAAIPLVLHKFKFDPAISSGVFLITITDTFSFLVFLGLAALLF
jgi:magnesium transporter